MDSHTHGDRQIDRQVDLHSPKCNLSFEMVVFLSA